MTYAKRMMMWTVVDFIREQIHRMAEVTDAYMSVCAGQVPGWDIVSKYKFRSSTTPQAWVFGIYFRTHGCHSFDIITACSQNATSAVVSRPPQATPPFLSREARTKHLRPPKATRQHGFA